MGIDIIKIKNTDKKENINNLTSDSLEVGELALVRESNFERLYCKNTDGEVTPLHRIVDAGEFKLPTIQSEWIDSGLAEWDGDTTAMNQVRFSMNLTGDFTPPSVSDFDRITKMDAMFYISKLTSINLKELNTSNVTSMWLVFGESSYLTSLDLSNWDTSNVTDMSSMFDGCSELTELDVSLFDTSNVTDMSGMFGGCSRLTSLDVSSFNTSKVTDMSYMFSSCSGLTSLDVSNFDTSNVTDMSGIFQGCNKLTSLDLSSWDMSNVGTMWGMFQDCSGLTSLNISSLDVNNPIGEKRFMIYNCDSLMQITCKQSFKDWCWNNDFDFNLPDAMKEGGNGTWIIVD